MKIIVFAILLVTFNLFEIFPDKDKISWEENRPLKWKDFKGKIPNKNTDDYAITSINFSYEILAGNKILISNYMNKKKSWVIKDKQTDNLLKHEQYHFNLSEGYAREMRKAMQKIEIPSTKNIQLVYAEWIQKHKEAQEQYDRETAHSVNRAEQIKWENKIDSLLNSLSEYKSKIVILDKTEH